MKIYSGRIRGTDVVNLWKTEREDLSPAEILESNLPFAVVTTTEVIALMIKENWKGADVVCFEFDND